MSVTSRTDGAGEERSIQLSIQLFHPAHPTHYDARPPQLSASFSALLILPFPPLRPSLCPIPSPTPLMTLSHLSSALAIPRGLFAAKNLAVLSARVFRILRESFHPPLLPASHAGLSRPSRLLPLSADLFFLFNKCYPFVPTSPPSPSTFVFL